MKAVSLFSGAGGIDLAFDRAGIQTVLQAESDPVCLSVLARHWADVERVDDVRKVDQAALQGRCRDMVSVGAGSDAEWLGRTPRSLPGVDLVYGGWPCQGNSVAGKRGGLSDERSGLWHEVRRVLSELRPRWFVGENVPGLLSVNRGADFLRVLMDLDDLGYGVAWRVLDARFFGVPQRRRRVFVVGCLGDASRAQAVLAVCESCGGHTPTRRETRETVAFTLAGGSPDTSRRIGNAWNTTYLPDVIGSEVDPESMRPLTERSTGYRMDAETENFVVAGALRASDGHHGHSSPRGDGGDNLIAFDWQASAGNDDSWRGKRRQHVVRSGNYAGAASATRVDAVAGGFGVRRLTPCECERLQGWPDGWTKYTVDGKGIPDSHRFRMIGNGVASPVAEWLAHRLVRVDNELIGETA